ncbi:TRP C-terminal domain-containing protein [Plasmodiophora brassicae]
MALLAVVLAGLILRCTRVDCSFAFPSTSSGSGALAGLDLYAPPVTSFLGPQPGDPGGTARSGPVVLFNGDMCRPTTLDVPGGVVFVSADAFSNAGCPFETRYLAMYASGAVAVILPVVDVVPSVDLYSNDGTRGAHTRHLPMLFLQIGPSSELYSALVAEAPGKNVTVYPDVNVWQATFASWYYQLFVRVLPSLVLVASGVTALVYCVSHARVICDNYDDSRIAMEPRSLTSRVAFARRSLRLPHAVLVIEVITATLSGIVLAVGGYYSTPNLPLPVVEYFITLLSGWSFTSSLLSSSVWIRHLSRVVDSNALLTRVLRGDHPAVFVALAVFPVALDTAVSIMFSAYINAPIVTTITSGIVFLLQLTVSLHVLWGVFRYYWTVRRTTNAVGGAKDMDAFLVRLSRCALGMSLSMILFCTGTALMGIAVSFVYSPPGFTVCFTLAYTGRALDSAFRVAMFRPRPTRPRDAVNDRHQRICVQTPEPLNALNPEDK